MNLNDLVQSDDVVSIGKRLLGAELVTSFDGVLTSGIIVETEAYKAPEDKGSHAFANKRTKRTETLFLEGGIAYVYLCYGIHHLFNIVTAREGIAHAVLIRAVEPNEGISHMQMRRKQQKSSYSLTNGPGKLTQALGIRTDHDSLSLTDPDSKIQVIPSEKAIQEKDIICTPRVGIAYAKECAHWPWRFRIHGNPWTSLPAEVSYD